MAVREFNGTSDQLICAIGAMSGMTFGTAAAIVKFNDVTDFRAIGHLHDSGGNFVCNPIGTNTSPAWEMHNGASGSQPGLAAVATGKWYLVVVRKATGSAAPRFSVYDYTAGTWAHAAGGTSLANWTAPGSGGNIQFSFQAGAGDMFNGRVAARAYWANTLPWTADAAGDTAIQSSGLKDAAANWVSNNPTAFWLFNQASVATPVPDLSTAGTANQSSISGTTVINGDDPVGYDFTLTAAPTPAVPQQRWLTGGRWPRQQQQIFPSGDVGTTTNAFADVATAVGTAYFDTTGGSISLNLISDNPVEAVGTAYDATVSTAPHTNASAGSAAGTGTANSATVKVSPGPSTATASGVANNATVTTGSSTNASAGVATGTGTANNPSPSVAPVIGSASATGTANNATVTTAGAANAQVATGTGTANAPNPKVAPTSGSAAASGVAQSVTGKVAPTPTQAAGTGTAFNPTVQTGSFVNANAGLASATGTANGTTSKVSPTPSTATAAGTANNPTITRGTFALAGVATATGVAQTVSLGVRAAAEAATALAAALAPTIGTGSGAIEAIRADITGGPALSRTITGTGVALVNTGAGNPPTLIEGVSN